MSKAITSASVLAAFKTNFNRRPRLFRAPARVNIIGEHCDYNDGYVMPVNTALFTWLAIAPRQDRTIRMLASDFGQLAEFNLDELYKTPQGGWQEYPKGVLRVLQDEGFELNGADIMTTSDIPLGGGLSSSASLETVMAFAMLSCAGHDIDRSRLALMCKTAENDFVGVDCGIMDQYVISLCDRDQAFKLDCRTLTYEHAPLPVDARLLIIHSGAEHRLSEGGLNSRRQECEQAIALLAQDLPGISALRDVSMEMINTRQELLGDVLYRRSRHVLTEIQRVRDAFRAMVSDDPATLGQLMDRSHESLKYDFEVSCSELDSLVDIARKSDGVYGSRMVGAGFGGCTVSLVDLDKVKTVAAEICTQYRKILGRDPWYHVVEASDPVGEILS